MKIILTINDDDIDRLTESLGYYRSHPKNQRANKPTDEQFIANQVRGAFISLVHNAEVNDLVERDLMQFEMPPAEVE